MENSSKHFIESSNLYLREVRETDVNENYYRWLNDSEITQHLESRFYPNSLNKILQFVKSKDSDPDNVFLAIITKDSDRHIGNIKLGPINWIHRMAEIGIFIGEKDKWGKGYACEAITLLSEYAFRRLNLRKLTAGCYGNNAGSQKAFTKAGFNVEGVRKSHFFFNGSYVDLILFGLVNPDY